MLLENITIVVVVVVIATPGEIPGEISAVNRHDLIEVFKIRSEELFQFDNRGKGNRGHSFKLIKVRCMRDSRRHFFLIEL